VKRLASLTLLLALGACVNVASVPVAPVAYPVTPVQSPQVPAGMQYLYGSGESAALSEQAYNTLVDAVRRRIASEKADLKAATDRVSVVLAPGATLDQPTTLPCGNLPRAVVFDVDETLLLNLGFEYDDALHPGRSYDAERWTQWEQTGADKVAAIPGAVKALTQLRAMGVTVIFNTNRDAATASFTEAALDHAGLGPAKHGDTLFLRGDVDGKAGKDGRRAAIAQRYCVVAMGGDQLGDFSDLFVGTPTVRREAVQGAALAGFWGRFWFVLPNPVYGTGLKGGFDEIFPADKRWEPGK
jgi:5'-nucleotidase (lipoprotein e(P4) family)